MRHDEVEKLVHDFFETLKADGWSYIFAARREGDGGWTNQRCKTNEFIAFIYVTLKSFCKDDFALMRECMFTITNLALQDWEKEHGGGEDGRNDYTGGDGRNEGHGPYGYN